MKVEDLPVYRQTHEFIVQIISLTTNFSKDYKFSLGERLKDECFELTLQIYRANSSFSSQKRKQYIEDGIERLKTIEMIIRLSKDLQLISVKQYSNSIEISENIGKQLWGWKKSSS